MILGQTHAEANVRTSPFFEHMIETRLFILLATGETSVSETKDRLMAEMKTCMKEGKKERLNVVRMLITEIKNAEINDPKEPGRARTEAEAQALIVSYHKQLSKSLKEYPQDRRAPLEQELKIVEEFMPKQLSSEELEKILEGIVEEHPGAAFGDLMRASQAKLNGQAPGQQVAAVLKNLMSK